VNKSDWAQFYADRFFEFFAVSFIFSRDIIFPYMWWSAMFEGREYYTHDFGTHCCNALLTVLLLLQVYWTSLIFIAVYKQMKNGGIEDIRSDDESEEEGGKSDKKIARKKTTERKKKA
jgi:hypothetical protein